MSLILLLGFAVKPRKLKTLSYVSHFILTAFYPGEPGLAGYVLDSSSLSP